MSKIGIDEVKRIARLANIAVSDETAAKLAAELDQIVGFVEQLSKVDTHQVEETSQVTGLVDVWRPDQVRPSEVTQEQLLQNAPASQDGYIKVKRVLG
jgi:aspartyl-tRNA(Asn)/glutamyl-tRNA(Gln) amidotransferase subunit C